MHVSDATFVVTDTETTGTKAETDRVIEIGAVKVVDGEIVDRYQQLVNPQRSIPGRITKLTGITTGMVFDAPPMEEVLPEYLDFLDDGVLTAHNLSFDKGFLDAELDRMGRDPLSNETLCTVRLARRLLPGLDSKGLSRLVQFYDITVDGRHRALGDAEATGIVLRRLLSQLAFEHEIEDVDDLLSFQHRRYQKVRETPSHLKKIRNEVLPDAPDAPGVYLLKNSRGASLYIGKAKKLSDRLRSHFTAVESKGSRKRKMLQKVRTVEWEETGTELEAILRESRLIKTEKPRYNRAQRRYYSRPFIRLDTTNEYPTLSWTRTLSDDDAEYYGPVRNTDRADMVVDVASRFFRLRECDDDRLHLGQRCLYADMDRCTVPCENEDKAAYARAVENVRAFLTGQDRAVLEELRARMQQASEERDFEKAAEIRDTLEPLETILEKQRVVAAPIRHHNAALVHRTKEATTADVLFVRFGRFVESVSCECPPTSEDRTRLQTHCRTHFDPAAEPPSNFTKRATDEIRLLSHWTYAHRDELFVVRWTPARDPETLVGDLCDALGGTEKTPGQVTEP
ncbi:DNA polymerase III subunit epsilon [Salinibacter sp. 10B]|uniref:DEDD exonuclease domain-containing protein n=1 Tax=Salinibacter sp. 10B TaxID=1923971 RepID=UPI000CF4C1D6|nr:DEDD exonuclease domain-containing protein [Salinibacter sp. 10B]PQJ34244.1 DNA polymerase III subunit epsilon [Salinibacter sp. 10B]